MQPVSPSIRERGQVPYGGTVAERASVPVVKAASIHHEQTPPVRTERQIAPPAPPDKPEERQKTTTTPAAPRPARPVQKDSADYKEVIYEGYGPHGIAVMVETATDNTNRTVANVRMHFSRCGGTLGNSGSVAFLFEHKCVFKFHVPAGTDFEELELSMIDLGVDEFAPEDETTVTVEAPYESFGAIQKWLDDQNYEIVSGESIRIATDTKELHGEEREAVEKLIERLEEDDDVVNVYTAMKDEAEEE